MNKQNKKILMWSLAVLIVLIFIGLIIFFSRSSGRINKIENENSDNDVAALDGLHSHPVLSIYIKGVRQEIPAGIGLPDESSKEESPIHTHDNSGIIHLEFLGVVKKEDLKLGNFFKVWKKKFDKNCIFEYCNGHGGTLKMFVNGRENFDFENYFMQDKDNIEIKFE